MIPPNIDPNKILSKKEASLRDSRLLSLEEEIRAIEKSRTKKRNKIDYSAEFQSTSITQKQQVKSESSNINNNVFMSLNDSSNFETFRLKDVESCFFNGFSNFLLPIVNECAFHPKTSQDSYLSASWTLARHYFSTGDFDKALTFLALIRSTSPDSFSEKQWLITLLALNKLGRREAASTLANHLRSRRRGIELSFAIASLISEFHPKEALDIINKYYKNNQLSTINTSESEGIIDLDLITTTTKQMGEYNGPLVSIVIPAYNCSEFLRTASKSIFNQTWRNIEIIIVDDHSDDQTLEVARSISYDDPRVRILEHSENLGAYACRNSGLRASSGKFVTVLDADDWAAPERIQKQVEAAEKGLVPNFTFGLEIQRNFMPEVSPLASLRSFGPTLSSYLFEREVLLKLGGWLPLRMSADNEMIFRYSLYTDSEASPVMPDTPMTFIRAHPQSLTRSSSPTNVRSLMVGARRELREAYTAWHESCAATEMLCVPPDRIPFGVPNICRSKPREARYYDVCYLSDFSMPGGTTADNVAMIAAGKRADLTQAILHWPRVDNASRPKNPKLNTFILNETVDQIVAGEEINCKLLIVSHPRVMSAVPDRTPVINSDAALIIMNQAPVTRSLNGQRVYRIEDILSNFNKSFDRIPLMAPLSPLIRRILKEESVTDDQMTGDDWVPILDTENWKRPVSIRADRQPIAGRHSRDDMDKWLDSTDALAAAYCVGTNIELRILGGAATATKRLGGTPPNWKIHPFDSMSAKSFLGELDFYIYYPQEDMYEAFGRAPMEAMATGMPVILPPRFAEVFADGAVYAEPKDVVSTIRNLWSNHEAYRAQVHRGWEYVNRHCSEERFLTRLSKYM